MPHLKDWQTFKKINITPLLGKWGTGYQKSKPTQKQNKNPPNQNKRSRQSNLGSEETQGVKRQPKPWKRGSRGCGSWTSPVSGWGPGSRESRRALAAARSALLTQRWVTAPRRLPARLAGAARHKAFWCAALRAPQTVASRSRTRFSAFESRPSPVFCLHGSFSFKGWLV